MTRHTSNGKPPHRGADKVPDKVRQQREGAEEMARAAAERLLTPAEPTPPDESSAPPQQAAEPSLEQRLADIERRAKQRVMEEKAALAAHYLTEARNAFRRAVSRTSDETVKTAYEDMLRLEKMAESVGGGGGGSSSSASARSDAGTGDGERPTRERRSGEALRADAMKMVAYLKGNPNSKGSAVTKATGVVVKPPLNVRTFIEKYAPGNKVTTEGQKAGTLYSIH